MYLYIYCTVGNAEKARIHREITRVQGGRA